VSVPALYDEEETEESHLTPVPGSKRGPGRPRLVVLSGMNAGEMLALDEGEVFTVGRAKGVQFAIEDTGVSRVHCRITRKRGRLIIEDMSSTNGTVVNGIRVARATLSANDRIQLGPSAVLQLRFVDEVEDGLARRLLEASTRDPLTGVHNRRYFHSRLEAEVSYARRHNKRLACLILDLDFFKAINDKHGHAAGDVVLSEVAKTIAKCVRTEDVVSRFGGEEFALLLRVNTLDDARFLAERIRAAVKGLRLPVGERTIRVTLSGGVAELNECGTVDSEQDLVGIADRRLYRAKALGRDQVCATE
jgi:diguanylate cyclase (GGDEF)-like protein